MLNVLGIILLIIVIVVISLILTVLRYELTKDSPCVLLRNGMDCIYEKIDDTGNIISFPHIPCEQCPYYKPVDKPVDK